MKLLRRLIAEQQGAVSLYLLLLLVPIFLFCALLIDFARIKTSEKEAENAVKTGVRSTLSAFSPSLHAYGLYALTDDREKAQGLFMRTVNGNVSGNLPSSRFQFIDLRVEEEGSSLTSMYSLGNHAVMKKQIMEEMKYRAPMIYSLEIADAFKKTGIASLMGQASQFSKNAAHIEKLLDERDSYLDKAWKEWTAIYQKASVLHPFYTAQLADLNGLSSKIGIHTVDEVRRTIQETETEINNLKKELDRIDNRIDALHQAGASAGSLLDKRRQLKEQMNDMKSILSDLEQLLQYILDYAKLIAMLKLKSTQDLDELKDRLQRFQDALEQAKKSNDELNAQLRDVQSQSSASGAFDAERAFQSIHLITRGELDEYGSKASSSVAMFSGLQSQLANVLLFDAQNYANADSTLQSFWKQVQDLYTAQSAKEAERNKNKSAANTSRQEQRKKAQPYLDQAMRAIAGCSLAGSVDPSKEHYIALQGDPSKGNKGYYQAYMEANQEKNSSQPVPVIDLDNADKAGSSALSLISAFSDLLVDVRDEFYLDEFAVSKFNYRTLGMEKDIHGQLKTSKELSQPESHLLINQELEYLLYGANSCVSNQTMAYAEMFAFRLAVGTTEALLEPDKAMLNLGSPLLVFLAAVAEGAAKAQQDMAKLVQGEAVPLSSKLGQWLHLNYKDYLRVFLLLHSRDKVLLSRMQSLIQLNTGLDLLQSSTYVSGTATTSIKLWFLPGLMKQLGKTGLNSCKVVEGRCQITKTGVMGY
ncbi:hypothetical protein ACFQ88_01585 [Paenibacillus sp. NPDC056579]|uniref:hypothetical protein n=1 Tax=Paenibacillus sp. NPDC056579 TaxID=3345871 RepID=UPI003688883E